MRSSRMWTRSSRVVRASDCQQCESRDSPGSIPAYSNTGIWGAAEKAVLNKYLYTYRNCPLVLRHEFRNILSAIFETNSQITYSNGVPALCEMWTVKKQTDAENYEVAINKFLIWRFRFSLAFNPRSFSGQSLTSELDNLYLREYFSPLQELERPRLDILKLNRLPNFQNMTYLMEVGGWGCESRSQCVCRYYS
jgi:hypothetical protein